MKAAAVQPSMLSDVPDETAVVEYHVTFDPSRGRLGGDWLPVDWSDYALEMLAVCHAIARQKQAAPRPAPPTATETRRPSTPRPRGVCVRCKSDAWVPNGRGWRCSKCLPEPP